VPTCLTAGGRQSQSASHLLTPEQQEVGGDRVRVYVTGTNNQNRGLFSFFVWWC